MQQKKNKVHEAISLFKTFEIEIKIQMISNELASYFKMKKINRKIYIEQLMSVMFCYLKPF